MMRSLRLAFVFASAVAGPVLAETADERLDRQCTRGLAEITSLPDQVPLTGQYDGLKDGWCQFSNLVFTTSGYTPDVYVQKVQVKGDALGRFLLSETGSGPNMQLEMQIEGLRLVPQVGQSQLDYLYRVQSNAWPIRAALSVAWDEGAKTLTLSKLDVDFAGDNALSLTARVANVDLSSTAAIQMSASGFAVTEATLDVTTHGLFESYLLIPLGGALLPSEGDMEAGVANLRNLSKAGVRELPDAAFPAATKDALTRLLDDLPNPAGRLTLALTADPGFGPVRLMGYAVKGVPTTIAEAAPLFDGVTVDLGWTQQDAE